MLKDRYLYLYDFFLKSVLLNVCSFSEREKDQEQGQVSSHGLKMRLTEQISDEQDRLQYRPRCLNIFKVMSLSFFNYVLFCQFNTRNCCNFSDF